MKTDTDIVVPTQKRGYFRDSDIHIAVLQVEGQSQSDFVQDNWHFSYFTLESLSFSILEKPEVVDAVFIGMDANPDQMGKLSALLNTHNIPFILYTNKYDEAAKVKALELKVDDYLLGAFTDLMVKRIQFIKKTKIRRSSGSTTTQPIKSIEPMQSIKIWKLKRLSDIILSLLALTVLSPILILIAVIIKLESRGPIFYVSRRAGAGYKIFNFYKFRSMRAGADKELKNLAHLNQYAEGSAETVFFKIKDDPRVTRFGMFLRNSSLDGLTPP